MRISTTENPKSSLKKKTPNQTHITLHPNAGKEKQIEFNKHTKPYKRTSAPVIWY